MVFGDSYSPSTLIFLGGEIEFSDETVVGGVLPVERVTLSM